MSKGDNWVDFKEIKSRVSMEEVLDHYGLLRKLKRKTSFVKHSLKSLTGMSLF